MSYSDGVYYSNQQADAYYYGQQPQQQQQMEEENTIDLRPADITEQQDKIIQLVAKYVVFSCDGARYQHKLVNKTKFNSYFTFITSLDHKYHEYYQYLIRSYTVWRDLAAASAAGHGGTDEGYAFYTEQLQQQEQQHKQEQQQASMYYTATINASSQYQDPSNADAGVATSMTSGGYYDANTAFSLQQQNHLHSGASVLGPSTGVEGDPQVGSIIGKRGRSATPQESSDDDDDENQKLEFVMENGVARVVSKRL